MPQNTTLTQQLSLATMIFEISVLKLVKIAMTDKNARGYHILASRAPDYWQESEQLLS